MQMNDRVIGEGLREIPAEAFAGSGISFARVSETVRRIGEGAFMGCEALESVILPEGLEAVGGGAFAECRSLREIIFPPGLIEIGEMAFCASGVIEVRIPEKTEKIGEMAFWDCPDLARADVTGPGTRIGKDAFGCCPGLKEGYIAPGYPAEDSPGTSLLFTVLWCTCPERHAAETGRRALCFIRENEELVMEKILSGNNLPAFQGLLRASPPETAASIRKNADVYLRKCREYGNRREFAAALLAAAAGDAGDDFSL